MANTPAQRTPANLDQIRERAAKRAEAQAKKFGRDRARMLAHVQTCAKQAEIAIAAGDLATHDKWLDATEHAITSYRSFVALSVAQTAPQAAPVPTHAG